MEKTCPRCGAKESKKSFVGYFCQDCYSQSSDVNIEPKVRFVSCSRCNKVQAGRGWTELSRKNLEDKLKQFTSGRFDSVRFVLPESLEGEALAIFNVKSGKSMADISRAFILSRDWGICTTCSRASSGYFESIIQLRCASPDDNIRLAKKFTEAFEGKTFIAKVEENKDGIDLYVGSNAVTLAAIERFGLTFVKTYSLHSADKEGKRIYRTTYCIRGLRR